VTYKLYLLLLKKHTTLDHHAQMLLLWCELQDLKNSAESSPSADCTSMESELTECPVTGSSINIELTEGRDQKECAPKGSDVQERIIACKEALLNLDAAAENAVHLFSALGIVGSSEEFSGEAGAKLYDEAAELLQSIAEKVDGVARLVHCRSNNSCGSRVEISGFLPLGIFAESLSQRVVEMLKENLSTS
jgi:hypothetical protein